MRDWPAELFIRLTAWLTAGLLGLLLLYLMVAAYGLPQPLSFLIGAQWQPTADPPRLGALPLLLGTGLTTAWAGLLALPAGLGTAVFLAEVAPNWLRGAAQLALELLAAVPSVVLGFVGAILLAPAVARLFALPVGFTALTGAAVLAVMIVPTVALVALSALDAVPVWVREASSALGATRWETIWRATVPSARRGLLTAGVLGLGRAAGETMAVLMVTGNVPALTLSPLRPVQTVTAAIAGEMGEAALGSAHYRALFALGGLLFLITLTMNLLAGRWLDPMAGSRRQRRVRGVGREDG